MCAQMILERIEESFVACLDDRGGGLVGADITQPRNLTFGNQLAEAGVLFI
jgi:hypothetical protein